jgi:GDP-fucose transporter C1
MDKKDDEAFLPKPAIQKSGPNHSLGLISAVVAFYFVISLAVVFLNKFILSNADFPYALFVTWYQLVVALVVLLIWSHLGKT